MKEFETKISIHHVSKWIVETLTKKIQDKYSLVKVHSECLHVNGELSVPLNIEEWSRHIDSVSCKNVKTILQYYFDDRIHSIKELQNLYNPDIIDRITADCETSLNPRLRIFLNRQNIAVNVLKSSIARANGNVCQTNNLKNCIIDIQTDKTSDLTNKRMSLLQNIVRNVLMSEDSKLSCNKTYNYILTTQPKGEHDKNSNKYVCGVVLNSSTGSKENKLMWEIYFQNKVDRIQELNSQRPMMNASKGLQQDDITKIAKAVTTFELVSGRPGSAIQLKNMHNEETIIKEAVFVLYNNARMIAILEKYEREVLNGTYRRMKSLEDQTVNFNLHYSDEEWTLIYNYLVKYPEMLQASVEVDPIMNIRTQSVFSFLSNLCHDFSRYYKKNKILTMTSDLSRMEEKLYLLQALRFVLRNTLTILGIEEIIHM